MSRAALNRTTFTTSRLLEFCSRKEMVAQTGTEPDAWPLMVVKELTDNALDAAEEAGIAPVIRVTVARGRIRVRDNGPGIPPETVASILDFSTRTSSREAYVAPDRGRQGNALKAVLAMPFALSGEEGRVEIVARGIRHEIAFRVDRIAQQPVIDHQQHPLKDGSVRIGTAITVHWPESAWLELEDARRHFLPILARFTDLNPHLSLCATWVDADRFDRREQWTWEATDPCWRKWTPSTATCPHWYRVADLERLAGAFLSHDRQRKTVRLLRDFLAEFSGLASTVKRSALLGALELQRAPLERLLKDGAEFDHRLVGVLLKAMQAAARPIKPEKLGSLGRDSVAAALADYDADPESIRYKLLKGVTDGVPWIVEAAFGYRPEAPSRQLLCGVNWSHALAGDPFRLGYQLGSAWCGPGEPIVLLAHLVCPRPEFLDRGKSTIANHSPGFAAVAKAVAEVTEAWAKQRRSEIRDRSRERRRQEKLRHRNEAKLSLKDAVLKHLPAVLEKTSDNGRLSFTQRDLFYGIRPLVQEAQDKSLSYGYFTALLTEIENESGEISGLQREARGTLYHPHDKREIPLSTERVAAYHRPFWTFNKLVYIEKAGTQKNLIEIGWPEVHDCAIASVAGFTTRALKDLVDLLAASTEPVTVFCVHDADAAGTMIYHTLQNETKARGARKIEVVNVGLEPWEGIEMGLDPEPVEPSEKRRAVAPYVTERDQEWRSWLESRGFNSWDGWLQKYRIELNAMPPATRVEWLTKTIEAHPPRKVIPPDFALNHERISAARSVIFTALQEQANLDERTDEILATIEWPTPTRRLPKIARRYLEHFRSERWDSPMRRSGRKIAQRILLKSEGEAP